MIRPIGQDSNQFFKYLSLLENLSDDAIASLYVTKFSIISLYLTKLYVT